MAVSRKRRRKDAEPIGCPSKRAPPVSDAASMGNTDEDMEAGSTGIGNVTIASRGGDGGAIFIDGGDGGERLLAGREGLFLRVRRAANFLGGRGGCSWLMWVKGRVGIVVAWLERNS
jgi:hypothetical protein